MYPAGFTPDPEPNQQNQYPEGFTPDTAAPVNYGTPNLLGPISNPNLANLEAVGADATPAPYKGSPNRLPVEAPPETNYGQDLWTEVNRPHLDFNKLLPSTPTDEGAGQAALSTLPFGIGNLINAVSNRYNLGAGKTAADFAKNTASGLTSDLGMITGGALPEEYAAKAGLTGIARGLTLARRLGSGAFAVAGGAKAMDPNAPISERAMGAFNAAMGGLGAYHGNPYYTSPEFQQIAADAAKPAPMGPQLTSEFNKPVPLDWFENAPKVEPTPTPTKVSGTALTSEFNKPIEQTSPPYGPRQNPDLNFNQPDFYQPSLDTVDPRQVTQQPFEYNPPQPFISGEPQQLDLAGNTMLPPEFQPDQSYMPDAASQPIAAPRTPGMPEPNLPTLPTNTPAPESTIQPQQAVANEVAPAAAQSIFNRPVEDVIRENPPVRGEGEYETFREQELQQAGPGAPGLSVEETRPGGFEHTITYRDSQGNPLATARIVPGETGPKVFSIASSKQGGLLTGRALKAVAAKIQEFNPTEIGGGLSPDAQKMLERLAPKAAKAAPAADISIPESPTVSGPEPSQPNMEGIPSPLPDIRDLTSKLGQSLANDKATFAQRATEAIKKFGKEEKGEFSFGSESPKATPKAEPKELSFDLSKAKPADQAEISRIQQEIPRNEILNRVSNISNHIDPDALKNLSKAERESVLRQASHFQRALLTAYDVSAPGRQGLPLIGRKEWWTSWGSMVRSMKSQAAFENVIESIRNDPSGFFAKEHIPGKKNSGSLAYEAGLELPMSEEVFKSSAAERIFGVTPSKRAYTAYLNKLRSDTFKNLVREAGAENNLPVAKQIADFINVSTGRGSLGKFEKSAEGVADIFFAPRYAASRVQNYTRVLNPKTYTTLNPVVRKEILKSAFATASTGLLLGQLAKQGGGTVESDPTSSDFGKIKIGKTRIDPFAGHQQYLVAAARLISGREKSSISNKTFDLTSGRYGAPTRADVAGRLITSKLAPIPSFVWAWMQNKEFDGTPFNVKTAMAKRIFPYVAQDIYELAQTDPSMKELLGGTAASLVGMGVQTYGK